MSKRIWIDPGHGGIAAGAVGYDRMEKDDNLTYALELARQFEAQGFEPVLTRTTDKFVELDTRTILENRANCALAIACHRNGAAVNTANGFEVWLHSKAPASYVAWAQGMAQGIAETGMALRPGQVVDGRQVPGVYRGYHASPNANYYANSGTNAPSCLLELGFMGSLRDNALFDLKYKEMCAAIVRASCTFLGEAYREAGDEPQPPTACPHCAELERSIAEQTAESATLEKRYRALREAVERFVAEATQGAK